MYTKLINYRKCAQNTETRLQNENPWRASEKHVRDTQLMQSQPCLFSLYLPNTSFLIKKKSKEVEKRSESKQLLTGRIYLKHHNLAEWKAWKPPPLKGIPHKIKLAQGVLILNRLSQESKQHIVDKMVRLYTSP